MSSQQLLLLPPPKNPPPLHPQPSLPLQQNNRMMIQIREPHPQPLFTGPHPHCVAESSLMRRTSKKFYMVYTMEDTEKGDSFLYRCKRKYQNHNVQLYIGKFLQ